MGNCVSTPDECMVRAARIGNVHDLRAKLEQWDVNLNMVDPATGCTMLSIAARNDKVEAVKELLARGANAMAIDREVGWHAAGCLR